MLKTHSVEISNLAIKSVKSNSMFCCFCACRAIQKGNQVARQNRARIMCVSHRANSLYTVNLGTGNINLSDIHLKIINIHAL